MTTQTQQTELALHGGPKAITGRVGKFEPKLGLDEFFSIASRFGFSTDAITRMRNVVSLADLPEHGPNLARYACPHPAPALGPRYEELAKQTFQVKHALATSSGTGALHAAMVAVGAKPGTEVIVAATGFMATAAAAGVAGATPVFCDVDESLQLDPTKLEACITPRTVAVAATHHWSIVADLDPILRICRKHNLKLIEDCAQSPGASYRGKPVGSIGDLGCFSISAYKIIGGGEGGMVISNDDRLFERACQLCECGGLWRKDRFGPPRYEGELFVGTNYRFSELEAAIDIVQLGKLPGYVAGFRKSFHRVLGQLKTYREIVPQKLNDAAGAIGYRIRFFPQTNELATQITQALRAEGVGAGHRGPTASPDWHLYSDMFPMQSCPGVTLDPRQCPQAVDLYNRAVSLGVDQYMAEEDCDMLAAAVTKVLDHYCTPDDSAPGWLRD